MPISAADLAVFVTASLMLNLTPGNDMMFVLGQSAKSGTRAGVAASLGIATGSLVHLALVALGAGVVLANNPQLFDAIRYAGVAYLLWLSWKAWMSSGTLAVSEHQRGTALAAWRDGTVVNLFNPKVIVFMFAFLPPFVHPENGNAFLQLVIFGTIFNIGGTLINILAAVFAGRLASALSGNFNLARWFARFTAGVFLVLAARLAFSPR
jgi:threonine/homoserine/homoserine lactone efflux protein